MNRIKYILVNILQTLLRGFPFPGRTGLIKIGNPTRNSPVFLTGNFQLTVARVKQALKNMDCYLLVANSRGINVWCAATGGHLTNHDVISVLKTSGIEALVDHRNVILPQLAATGLEALAVHQKSGWNVHWGPVYARDIPKYLENNFKKTATMRDVQFPLGQRMEMAVMWAFPFSLIATLIALFFKPPVALPLAAVIWGLALFIFAAFPLYSPFLNAVKKKVGLSSSAAFAGFSVVPLLLWGFFILILLLYAGLSGQFAWGFLLPWFLISFVTVFLITVDIMGSTPVYKSGLQEERLMRIVLDKEKCKTVGYCQDVCPRNCYQVDEFKQTMEILSSERCVQCGACVVQCPTDALCFSNAEGEVILPQTVRKYKLNMLGKRFAGKS